MLPEPYYMLYGPPNSKIRSILEESSLDGLLVNESVSPAVIFYNAENEEMLRCYESSGVRQFLKIKGHLPTLK